MRIDSSCCLPIPRSCIRDSSSSSYNFRPKSESSETSSLMGGGNGGGVYTGGVYIRNGSGGGVNVARWIGMLFREVTDGASECSDAG